MFQLTQAGRAPVALLVLILAAGLCTLAPRPAQAQFTFTNLYSFTNVDGSNPVANLILASDGNFYGTTYFGGNKNNNSLSGNGTVFRISPGGTEEVLYQFNGPDGAQPSGALIQSSDGNFYGTTFSGGNNNNNDGTVFKITPAGVETVLHSFTGGSADGF